MLSAGRNGSPRNACLFNGLATGSANGANIFLIEKSAGWGETGRVLFIRVGHFWACGTFPLRPLKRHLLDFRRGNDGRPEVDYALKLNVLAVLAAFVFVGAILLGAF